jgi:hypothetical protein
VEFAPSSEKAAPRQAANAGTLPEGLSEFFIGTLVKSSA